MPPVLPVDPVDGRLPAPVDPAPVDPAPVDPAHRISDREREATVARLRKASGEGVLDLDEFSDRVELAYAARTHADLDELAADLPSLESGADDRFAPVEWTVAVCSSQRQGGPWRPAPTTRALALLGTCRLDLSEAELEPETEVEATAVFGGVDILVPDGARVELTGFVFAGSKDYRVRADRAADGPRLRVRARGAFGGVTVRSRPRPVP